MEFDIEQARKDLEKKLKFLSKKDYIPAPLFDLISKVAKMQLEALLEFQPPKFDESLLASDSDNLMGKPYLARENFPYDLENGTKLFFDVLKELKSIGGDLEAASKMIENAIKTKELVIKDAFDAFLKDDQNYFSKWAELIPNAPKTLNFIVQTSLTPSLEITGRQLAELLPQPEKVLNETPINKELQLDVTPPAPRNHGHCPICGSMPLTNTLKFKQGFRYANCSFCHTSYRIKRLSCSFCDETDQKKLKFFNSESMPGYRVDVCDSCKRYIKTADFREMEIPSIPILDDLDSLPLDFIATKEGYSRSTSSGWGF